jgi:uncharacterized phosphosugar-binding protein
MSARQYLQSAREALDKLIDTQLPQIQSAARLLADTITSGGSIFSFGASHSFMITEELVYRTGGLMLVNPIYPHGMNLSVRPLTLTSQLERVVGLGRELLDHSPAKGGDVLILVSTSGRNAVVIDMALLAREKGIQTIAITSLAYNDGVTSRHPSGKKLTELADIIIDNGAPYGDAVVEIPGCRQKVGPLSSVTGCALADALMVETVQLLVQHGMTPPVFMSANLDGGDDFNAEQLRIYRDRIHYL